jgi:site-specific recombinase XerD
MTQPTDSERAKLRQFLTKHFSLDDLKDLAFDLGVDFQSFPHDTTRGFARELIAHFERRGTLDDLRRDVLRKRPGLERGPERSNDVSKDHRFFPSLDEATEQFVNGISRSARTRETYALGLKIFQRFLQETAYAGCANAHPPTPGLLSTAAFQDDVLLQFCRWLLDQDYSESTINTYLSAAKRLFRRLYALDQLPTTFNLGKALEKLRDFTRDIERHESSPPNPDRRIPQILLYYDEKPLPGGEENYLKRLRILRARAVVHTIYASAGRVSEVASLDRADVQDGGVREVMITGKRGKKRLIFLTSEAQRAIRAYTQARGADGHKPLFISHGRNYGSRLSRQTMWRTVKQAVTALGLYEGISPHDFRHYRATQLLNDGARLEDVQAILGHEHIGTTRDVYARTDRRTLREVYDTFTRSPREALADLEEQQRHER